MTILTLNNNLRSDVFSHKYINFIFDLHYLVISNGQGNLTWCNHILTRIMDIYIAFDMNIMKDVIMVITVLL